MNIIVEVHSFPRVYRLSHLDLGLKSYKLENTFSHCSFSHVTVTLDILGAVHSSEFLPPLMMELALASLMRFVEHLVSFPRRYSMHILELGIRSYENGEVSVTDVTIKICSTFRRLFHPPGN